MIELVESDVPTCPTCASHGVVLLRAVNKRGADVAVVRAPCDCADGDQWLDDMRRRDAQRAETMANVRESRARR